MAGVGRTWEQVATDLGEILEYDKPRPGTFEAAASRVADIADREEAVFEAIAADHGHVEE